VDATGRRVAFTSAASNLVPGAGAAVNHAYVRDRLTRRTILLDRTAAGTPATNGATDPLVSADGTTAVFESRSPDLPGAPAAGSLHLYVVDLASGAIALVDRSTAGVAGDSDGFDPDISGDGRRIAFVSSSTNFGGGTQFRDQVYVRDLAAKTTTWVSVPQDGDPAHSYASAPALSRDGRRIAFGEQGAAFGFGAPNHDSIFVRDLVGGTTTLASTGSLGPADRDARDASLSADGTKVSFVSSATNLPGGSEDLETPYVRDLAARTTVAVAHGRMGEQDASLSGNGACVAFDSHSDDLVHPSYGPDFNHVFLHALSAACAPSGSGAARDTTAPVIRSLRVSHRRFALARRKTARTARAKRGTTFVFRLSEKARTTITIARRRRSGHRIRLVRVATLVRARTVRGTNKVAYSGRIGKRALARGSYLATAVAIDAAGNRSARRSVRFAVVRR
jgi:Tol biopolymer transport system component